MEQNLDIQSIYVLVKMHELRNVKSVADVLGKTSSAVSKILAKLKLHYEDPLFVQGKNGFEPTTFVDSNLSHFEQILASFDAIQHIEFDPKELKQEIVLYGHARFWDNFGDTFYLAIREQAPLVKVSMRQWNQEARLRLAEGEDAVFFSTYDESMPQVIIQKPIREVSLSFFVRQQHPAQNFQDLLNYPFVMTRNPGWNDVRYPLLERLKSAGYEITPKIEIENTLAIENIVRTTDYYSLTMGQLMPQGCRGIELPQLSDLSVNFVMSYHRAKQNDPQKEWLFKLIRRVLN